MLKIGIIGAGNAGTQLGRSLKAAGYDLEFVLSKTAKSASLLAKQLHCRKLKSIQEIPSSTELILICVPDDIIPTLVEDLKNTRAIVAHVSGSSSMEQLGQIKRRAVFYPLQTMRKDKEISLIQVPFLIEARYKKDLKLLLKLAKELSSQVYEINSAQRKIVHLSAVFCSNFINRMLKASADLLEENQLSPELIEALSYQVLDNAFIQGADQSLTGPAKRNDRKTLQTHLDLLKEKEDLREIYKLLSQQILAEYKHPPL